MKNIDVTFITINYNSSSHTIELLKSIIKYTALNYQVIIVDNASKEEDYINLEKYCEQNENFLLIKNSINCGFACGNMTGAKYADSKYLFFVNNDTKLLNDCASILKNYLDLNSDVALATAKVCDEDGNFSSSYKLFPTLTKELLGNSVARKFSSNNFPSNKSILTEPTLVEVISGSCMFFRAKTFKDINGFDENFFLYCEEEDISKRVWNHGDKVIFIPEANIYHEAGGSTTKSFYIEREYYISYKYLIYKHYSFFKATILYLLVLLKLFRRSFKRKNGYKLLLSGLKGFNNKDSLKYKQ